MYLKSRKIKEIREKDTQICDDLVSGWDEARMEHSEIIGITKEHLVIKVYDEFYKTCYILIFSPNEKLRAIIHTHNSVNVSINITRGLIIAFGSNFYHEYWIDDGEYNKVMY